MEYSTRLPAAHLGGDDLSALEDTLRAGCTSPELEVTVDLQSVTYRYSSLEALGEDATLPGVVRCFEVTLTATEGRLELLASGRDDEFVLELSGDREWVASKRRSVEGFFETHGESVRTFLERYLAFCLSLGMMGLCLLLYYGGYGPVVGMRQSLDALLFGSLALIGGGLVHMALNHLYPYVLLIPAAAPDSLIYRKQ